MIPCHCVPSSPKPLQSLILFAFSPNLLSFSPSLISDIRFSVSKVAIRHLRIGRQLAPFVARRWSVVWFGPCYWVFGILGSCWARGSHWFGLVVSCGRWWFSVFRVDLILMLLWVARLSRGGVLCGWWLRVRYFRNSRVVGFLIYWSIIDFQDIIIFAPSLSAIAWQLPVLIRSTLSLSRFWVLDL